MLTVIKCENCEYFRTKEGDKCETCVKESNFKFDILPYYTSFSPEMGEYIFNMSNPSKVDKDRKK